ncbi:G1/S-specific cyclin-D1-like isoform X2 [Erpetoichthys calabaricus]|uniref:G1/S-specific cyclin-D1-like isoform X2 n=1 Tax=Erpetoichthys calabaricus TaxID=27687 RepID=UPI0022348ECB|nr:G1/S-specific cyclin-D1-like isoform X2 [Erpetoichthys calabaricus]
MDSHRTFILYISNHHEWVELLQYITRVRVKPLIVLRIGASMDFTLWCCESEDEEQNIRRVSQDSALTEPRILESLLNLETRYLPSASYFSSLQSDIRPGMRTMLANWLLQVSEELGCSDDIFCLSLNLLDRYLSLVPLERSQFQLLGAACLFIACKVRHSDTLSAYSLCFYSDFAFTASELQEMERIVLNALRWDVAGITPQDFLPHFLEVAGLRESKKGNDKNSVKRILCSHAKTLVILCVTETAFLAFPPSLVAAASLISALKGMMPAIIQSVTGLAHRIAKAGSADLLECALTARIEDGKRNERKNKKNIEELERSATPTDLQDVDL